MKDHPIYRISLLMLALACAAIHAEEAEKNEWQDIPSDGKARKYRAMLKKLRVEDAGKMDDLKTSEADQIEAASKRFESYVKDYGNTETAIERIKACRKRVLERIIERARQRITPSFGTQRGKTH